MDDQQSGSVTATNCNLSCRISYAVDIAEAAIPPYRLKDPTFSSDAQSPPESARRISTGVEVVLPKAPLKSALRVAMIGSAGKEIQLCRRLSP
jgi:hypothetical protein